MAQDDAKKFGFIIYAPSNIRTKLMSWLNADALENKLFISVTFDTSHFPMSWFNPEDSIGLENVQ